MDDYDREDRPADYLLPDAVRTFVQHLYTAVLSANVEEMKNLYRKDYPLFTNSYYKTTPWPEADVITELVDNDPSFLVLYKEMYYRHLFATISAQHYEKRHGEDSFVTTIEHRIDSWTNYCALLDGILTDRDALEIAILPDQWVWDILGEFVYQFQSFCQYRTELGNRSNDEIAILRENEGVWQARKVLSYLHRLIQKSNIKAILRAEKEGQKQPTAPSEILKQFGYFSLISLSRAELLLCDYTGSLKTLAPLNFGSDAYYYRIAACHIPLFYHMGVAQLFTRRYVDAIRSFSSIVLYITRNKNYYQRFDQILKLNDKILALLAIALSICPGRRSDEIDEQVHNQIREKYGEKYTQMQRGEIEPLEELFRWASPKFIVPAPHSFEDKTNHHLDAYNLQVRLFVQEALQQQQLPTLRSYLKLYRTISLSKLARFRDSDEDTLRYQLISYKHKTFQYQRSKNNVSPSEGVKSSALDVKYFLNKDMIHIEKIKTEQRQGVYFISQIKKFRDIERDVTKRRY